MLDATADEEGRGGGGLALLLGVSIVAHAAMFATLGRIDHRAGVQARRRPPAQVTVQVARPKPTAPPPEAVPPPAPKPAARRIAAAEPPPAKAPPPPAPEPETPADFSGVTLTNDGAGPGWASAVGNGASMRGPIGRPGARVTGGSRDGEPAERPAGSPIVALGSLSRPPAPPDLADVLERHYPEAARRQGLAGEAVLRARITPDGRARDLVLVSQTTGGFGDACRATLHDSIWTAPLDREGRAVATLVTYTCRFEVH